MMQFATLYQATKSCDTKLYHVCWALLAHTSLNLSAIFWDFGDDYV